MKLPLKVRLMDVGPRDGLQNEKQPVPATVKIELGVWNFQSSIAGLGGCPYAKGATGNVATEDLVYLLHGMGVDTGVDLDVLIDVGQYISDHLGRPNCSRVARALLAKRAG